jgi:hypothetical protein
MRDDLTVKVELEAEDKLAVRLKSLQVDGPPVKGSTREALERQTHAILAEASIFEGGLALLEVDGVSNAVLLRSPKPAEGRFVEVILRNGTSIKVEARGGAIHLSREKYEKLTELFNTLLD